MATSSLIPDKPFGHLMKLGMTFLHVTFKRTTLLKCSTSFGLTFVTMSCGLRVSRLMHNACGTSSNPEILMPPQDLMDGGLVSYN